MISQKEQKLILLDHALKGCTLNGKPAKICGFKNQFATVAQIDGPLAIEFSWEAVKRIMNKDGKFST